MSDWLLEKIINNRDQLNKTSNIIFVLVLLAYVGYFMLFGFNSYQQSGLFDLKVLTKAIIGSVLAVIAFIVFHFSGTRDFSLKWIIVLPALTVAGTFLGYVVAAVMAMLG